MSKKPDPIAERKKYYHNQDQAIKQFNTVIQKLLEIAITKDQGNDTLLDARTALKAIVKHDPEMAISYSKSYIWKYKDQIKTRDEQLFTNSDYSEDIKSINKDQIADQQDTETINQFIVGIKKIWMFLNKHEKSVVWNNFETLLKSVAIYVSSEKKIKSYNKMIKDMISK